MHDDDPEASDAVALTASVEAPAAREDPTLLHNREHAAHGITDEEREEAAAAVVVVRNSSSKCLCRRTDRKRGSRCLEGTHRDRVLRRAYLEGCHRREFRNTCTCRRKWHNKSRSNRQ